MKGSSSDERPGGDGFGKDKRTSTRTAVTGTQRDRRSVVERYSIGALYVLLTIGAAVNGLRTDLMPVLTPVFLILTSVIILINLLLRADFRAVLWVFAAWVFTHAVEAVSVQTGHLFGAYYYGGALGYQVMGVPIIVGGNWVIVVCGAAVLARRLRLKSHAVWFVPLAATLLDVFLESIAMELSLWHWQGSTVPGSNYVFWFITAGLVYLPVHVLNIEIRSRITIHYYIVTILTFLLIKLHIVLFQ